MYYCYDSKMDLGHSSEEVNMVALKSEQTLNLKEYNSDMKPLYSFTPQTLKQLRERSGWNQTELSEKTQIGDDEGVSQQAISQYETGKTNPTEEALRKIGRALDVVFVCDWDDEEWVKETPRYKKTQSDS